MARITALLHTQDDALRVGRCLETLYACDDVVIVDHGSRDGTLNVAREYGAKVISATHGAQENYGRENLGDWILCLDARESLSEALSASLYEWKSEQIRGESFSVYVREETAEGWIANPAAETRLVPASWARWHGKFPASDPSAVALEGELLRFVLP